MEKKREIGKTLLSTNNNLTRREQCVLVEIAKGYSTKEIAARLFISENTIESHRQNIFAKLKAHNMADMVIKAIVAGYIEAHKIAGKDS